MFLFGNTEKTNASDYFTHLKAPTKFSNSGFTLGGPIVRNKLFFFGDYQRTSTTPATSSARRCRRCGCGNGDFGEVAQPDLRPVHRRRERQRPRRVREQHHPGRIASARLRAACSRSSPSPTSPAPLGQNNYQKAQTREKTTDGFDAKVNYAMNEKDQTSFRLSFMRPVVFDPGLFGEYGGPANGGFAGTGTNTSWSGAGTWTRVFSAQDGARRARRAELLQERHHHRRATA